MRLALPRLPALRRPSPAAGAAPRRRPSLPFALMPDWLVAVGRDGTRTSWRVRRRWDGRARLEPAALRPGSPSPCVVVLDPDLPFRRKLQRFPATARARQALLRAAPDEFPLPSGDVRYALGMRAGEGYLLALPVAELDRLREDGLAPAAVVAGETLDEAGCIAALATLESRGDSANFLRGKPLIPRAGLRLAALAASLMVFGGLALQLLLGPDLLGGALAWRNVQMRKDAGELRRIFVATEAMVASREAAAKLYAQPEANVSAVLGQVLATAPPGHTIRRIEIGHGMLRLAGSGADVQAWLTAAGFPAQGIVVEEIGKLQTWQAERPL